MTDLFEYAPTYPDAPGYKSGDTSAEAAKSAKGFAKAMQRKCFDALRQHGPSTADEIAERLELSVLSVRPRFSELRRDHRIEDTGTRRKNASGMSAKVWAVAGDIRQHEAMPR